MPNAPPPDVSLLLHSDDGMIRDAAWDRFVAAHSRLTLHSIRTVIRDPERVMDAYAWILERLHEDRSRRLKAYDPAGPGQFTTWLVVVVRRLSVDFLRHQGGRTRDRDGRAPQSVPRELRRRLLALAGEPVELERLPGPDAAPDVQVELEERRAALQAALGEIDPLDRLMLALRFDDGLGATQIARALHLPTQFHVYRRLHRVLKELRIRLDGRGFHDAS